MDDETKALLEFAERLSAYSDDDFVSFDMEKLRAIMRLANDDTAPSQSLVHETLSASNSLIPYLLH